MEDWAVIERASAPPEIALNEAQLVLLDIAGSVYYTLDGPVAVRIWQLLETARPFGALVDSLVAEFDIDRVSCKKETVDYVQTLLDKKLVRVSVSP